MEICAMDMIPGFVFRCFVRGSDFGRENMEYIIINGSSSCMYIINLFLRARQEKCGGAGPFF
jgi:hypothetical protein